MKRAANYFGATWRHVELTAFAEGGLRISGNASVSLDLLRASAAMMVFLHHCHDLSLDGGVLSLFNQGVGHSAVVIFFVLSGYVISATLPSSGSVLDYGIKRAARIYSVAVPAVLLTWLLDVTAVRLGFADSASMYQLHKPWIYLPIALTFIGNFWRLSEPAFSNGPYWSLDYEVWYYVIFGIAMFARGPLRLIGLALVSLAVGPKLWLLFPIWLGGVAVCRLQQISIPPARLARALVAISILLFLLVKATGWEVALNAPIERLRIASDWLSLGFSNLFVGDYLVGGITMLLVYGIGGAEFVVGLVARRVIVRMAQLSFGLYLMHYPLLWFFGQLMPATPWLAIAAALACALGFAAICEPQKDRIRKFLNRSLTHRLA